MSNLPNYRIEGVVGKGAFGVVYKAYDLTRKKFVAIKRLRKHSRKLSREFEILFHMRKSNYVVAIEDFFYSECAEGKIYQNIVFEFVSSDLDKYIQMQKTSGEGIEEFKVKSIMYQILKGLADSHAEKIVHRDLKPQNVLIDQFNLVKICDFGCAKMIPQNKHSITHIASQHYRAPELILCITNYNSPVDIWAAGCILAQLFLLHPLFDGFEDSDQLIQMFRTIGSFTPKQKKEIRKRAPIRQSVYKKLTQIEFERTGLETLFDIVIDYDNFEDLLLRMLKYLPEERISADEALKHPFFDEVRTHFQEK